jgi:hypothetical protein
MVYHSQRRKTPAADETVVFAVWGNNADGRRHTNRGDDARQPNPLAPHTDERPESRELSSSCGQYGYGTHNKILCAGIYSVGNQIWQIGQESARGQQPNVMSTSLRRVNRLLD